MAEEEILPACSKRGGENEASLGDASLIDFEETKGLTKVFTDLVKHIANLNDPSKRHLKWQKTYDTYRKLHQRI